MLALIRPTGAGDCDIRLSLYCLSAPCFGIEGFLSIYIYSLFIVLINRLYCSLTIILSINFSTIAEIFELTPELFQFSLVDSLYYHSFRRPDSALPLID